ncbi:MAG: hypothetical protein R3208_05220 [Ketobacteraceae bacterium]|nr:hypothetical protein [Ketobacteraceae bacterium]
MLKAFSLTDNLPDKRPQAMPPDTACHWLDIRYEFDDPERTPVAAISYRLVSQVDPDFSLEGKTSAHGRIFTDQVIAGHYDLTLLPQPDVQAEQEAREALKSLSLDLANISLQLQRGGLPQEPASAREQAFAVVFLDQDDIRRFYPAQWLADDISPDRRELLLLFLDQPVKDRFREFLDKAPHPDSALQILHRITMAALDVREHQGAVNPLLQALIDSAAGALRHRLPGLKSRLVRQYARVAVNQQSTLSVAAFAGQRLALNHQHDAAPRNLLSFRHLLPFQSNHTVTLKDGTPHVLAPDFSVGDAFPLIWQRCYNTETHSWHHPFSASLTICSDRAEFTCPGGRTCRLRIPRIGSFTTHLATGIFLYRDSRQRWLVKAGEGAIMTFRGTGSCQLQRITSAQGHYWHCDYDEGSAQLRSIRDNTGRVLRLLYQSGQIQQILLQTAEGGNVPLAIYDYDSQQRLQRVVSHHRQAEVYHYEENRLAAISVAGNQVPHQSSPCAVPESIRREKGREIIEYHDHRQLRHQYLFEPDTQIIRVTNALGHGFVYHHNGFGQLTAYLDPSGGGFNLLYDDQQRLTGFCDALGHNWSCTFNGHGQIDEIRFPSGKTYSYRYDLRGQPVAILINGQLERHLNWSTGEELLEDSLPPGETRATPMASFETIRQRLEQVYGDACEFEADGFLKSLPAESDAFGRVVFRRDPAGRMLSREMPGIPPTQARYNGNGQLVELNTPENSFMFDYDEDGHCLNPDQDPYHLLARLDPMAHVIPPVTREKPIAEIKTPYTRWTLRRWEALFSAFSHAAHQDALFSLALWQTLNTRTFQPFCREP